VFAVVYLPNFQLQAVLRLGRTVPPQPVALLDSSLSKAVIVQSNPPAKAAGVTDGMTPSQAMARCPNLNLLSRCPRQEASATEILLQTAYAFSPNIESTRPGVCTLELKGLGLAASSAIQDWCEKLIQALQLLDFEAVIGIGPTPDLAWLAAQPVNPATTDDPNISDPSGQIEFAGMASLPRRPAKTCSTVTFASESFVAALPIAALTPPAAIADVLSRWGVRTVGEFLTLGKSDVAERLGAEALELFDRVSPHSLRPLKLHAPPELFSEAVEFEGEIESAAPLLSWLSRFTEQLSRRVDAIYLVVAQLRLSLGLASGAKYERTFKIPSPTGDARVLLRMLQTHLETLRMDSPIVSLQLAATPARPGMHQFGLFQNTLRNPNGFAETLTRLGAVVGAANVGTPVLETSHRPDAFRLQPPNFEFVPAPALNTPAPAEGLPFRRFRPPLPAQFEIHENKPARVSSPCFNGAVADVRGPFLSSGNWWDDHHWAREEWDVQLAGGALLRLFRTSDGCFVEGVYD
jgi:protein ImuB